MYNNPARQHFTFDYANRIADEAAITTATTTIGQIDAANGVVDWGAGRINAHLVIDITVMDLASTDELYQIVLFGSNSATHASGITVLAELSLGVATALLGDVASVIGRYVLPFSNAVGPTAYRYGQLKVISTGTTPALTYSAWIAHNPF